MASKYQFTETAYFDLDNALKYISNELCNPIAAKNYLKRLLR